MNGDPEKMEKVLEGWRSTADKGEADVDGSSSADISFSDGSSVSFETSSSRRLADSATKKVTVNKYQCYMVDVDITEGFCYEVLIDGSTANKLDKEVRFKYDKRDKDEFERVERAVDELFNTTIEMGGTLSGGEQEMLAIARAMISNPKLLLLDEPAAGMNPQETDELTAFIGEIRDNFGLTIFMIEHHMDLVMEISDRIYVLDFGKPIAEGVPEEIQNNQRVIDAYLGGAADE